RIRQNCRKFSHQGFQPESGSQLSEISDGTLLVSKQISEHPYDGSLASSRRPNQQHEFFVPCVRNQLEPEPLLKKCDRLRVFVEDLVNRLQPQWTLGGWVEIVWTKRAT